MRSFIPIFVYYSVNVFLWIYHYTCFGFFPSVMYNINILCSEFKTNVVNAFKKVFLDIDQDLGNSLHTKVREYLKTMISNIPLTC